MTCGTAAGAREREVQVVDVEVDDVELGARWRDLLEQQDVVRQRVDAARVEPQRPRRARHQPRRGHRVAAGEQRDVVALRHELLGQVGDDALGAAVERGGTLS